MKKTVIILAASTLILGAVACKPKQSHYRQVYESAKQREIAETNASSASESNVIISKQADPVISVRKERLNPIEGEDGMRLKQYSVVIGSFQNSTNAYSLKERMAADGYSPVLARNENGMLRVIVTSFNTREEAARSKEAIKQRYAPNFQDAWLLERDK